MTDYQSHISANKSALHRATARNDTQALSDAIANSDDLNVTVAGLTALHVAARTNSRQAAVALLEHGANVDTKCDEGATALHHAALVNAHEIVEALLKRGARVNLPDKHSYTALHIASQQGATDAVKVLLEHRANVNVTGKKGVTPLHLAAYANASDTILVLLAYDAAIDAKYSQILHQETENEQFSNISYETTP